MDANGARFWMLCGEDDWSLNAGARLGCRGLTLAEEMPEAEIAAWPVPGEPEALATLEVVPQTIDAFGVRAGWDPVTRRVISHGPLPGTVVLYAAPAGSDVTDLAVGGDGLLFLAVGGSIVLRDLRGRWAETTLEPEGFQAWRLAADPLRGCWVLDRQSGTVARVEGSPLPLYPQRIRPDDIFGPVEPNPDPPRLVGKVSTPPGHRPVAIASGAGGLALLTWSADGSAIVWRRDGGKFDRPTRLVGAIRPTSLAWLSNNRVAVLVPGLAEAAVYDLGPADSRPVGLFHPLPGHDGGPFAHGPSYPTASGLRKLVAVSSPQFASVGKASGSRSFDSGDATTVWHRLYLEAEIPPGCGLVVRLAATDSGATNPQTDWHEHRFGTTPGAVSRDIPRGAWLPTRCEKPTSRGRLGLDPVPERVGLFTALIQRPGRRVRSLRGRFLHVEVTLHGDGRSAPSLAALRAYSPRFSYVDQYLPALYHEVEDGEEADREGDATPADFLGRFVSLFEGVLTPIEDQIAASAFLTDARTAPEDSIEWLAAWVGLAFDPAYPADRRREHLLASAELARSRGTIAGLSRALNIATGGGVDRGEVVIVESFRLRRTFATILGARLSDVDDPLLAGLSVSGNSFVGETLFLGDDPEKHRGFLALFAPSAILNPDESADVAAFLDAQASRLTVLVHREMVPDELGLVRRVVGLEAPAHVESRVVAAPEPFRVSVASLLGVDTFLRERPPRGIATLGQSKLGGGDVLQGVASLDPRLGGADVSTLSRPLARAASPVLAREGRPFTLDASESLPASTEATIDEYDWTWLVPPPPSPP